MTPSQLEEKYKTLETDQLKYLAYMHRRAADNSQKEAAYLDIEIKRRNRNAENG